MAPAHVVIERVNISIVDGAVGYNEFAGLGSGLTNGVKIEHQTSTGGVLLDFTDGRNIKFNHEWTLLAGVDNVVFPAAGNDSLPVRWTIGQAGAGLILKQGEKLAFTIQDATSAISVFDAMAQGVYYGPGED